MSLRFRYNLIRTGRHIPSLGGRTVRPRPLVLVGVTGPADTAGRIALLDTGADDTVFPESLAAVLGIDLAQAPVGSLTNADGTSFSVRYADVTLRLTDGNEKRVWPAIAFASAQLIYPLLGFAGCLQYFWANFMGDREEVELTVNSLYPGT